MGMRNSPTQRNAALEVSNYYFMTFGAARRSDKWKSQNRYGDP